ncbi:uncharacterized protein [Eurosta solidaginis]|uniref:uncharacterized protein n=1 Tax=Eurosta solidaginis TaxID=178769 RepID=UPI003530A6C8
MSVLVRHAFSKCSLLNVIRGFKSLIDVHPTVQRSLQNGDAVVALETTIITHGMPYPKNIETALEVEQLVKENGAVAATIAIINGRLKVGLTRDEMEQLASKSPKDVQKCSRRDLSYLVAMKRSGGTTVAATMIIAHMVGIDIFATGGVGGVHRNGHITMDISADTIELGRTPVAVVSSGVKSILDIPRTLEYLETQGVCVVTYKVDSLAFPDFYTPDSGCKASHNLNGPSDAADLIKSLKELKLKSGILIGVPIPEQYAVDKIMIEQAIKQATYEAQSRGITGKDITPYLLAAIAKITNRRSLDANVALIKNNACTAAQIARELYKKNNTSYNVLNASIYNTATSSAAAPLVIGASILDLSITMRDEFPPIFDGATYPAVTTESAGGVGRNIAEGIFKLYGSTNFISIVGNDQIGQSLLKMMPTQLQNFVSVDDKGATSLCTLLLDKEGDCKIILGNMEIHEQITPEMIQQQEEKLNNAPIIVMDSNLSLAAMECTLQLALKHQKPVFFEPTDMRIAHKPFTLPRKLTKQIKIISPNIYELYTIVEAITKKPIAAKSNNTKNIALDEIKDLLALVNDQFDCIILTLGAQGVVLSFNVDMVASGKSLFDANTGKYLPPKTTSQKTNNSGSMRFYNALKVENIKNVSGAGDSFTSGFITALLRGYNIKACVAFGFVSAERALQSNSAVPTCYFKNQFEESVSLKRVLKNLKEIIL